MAHLPADVLTAVLRQALPAPDADGFLRAQDVARVCASFGGTCRAWREALLKHLSAPSQGGHKGLRLLCAGGEAELAWLHTLPAVGAAKFTHQEDRQPELQLVWTHGRRGSSAGASVAAPEEGLERRRRDILSGLPTARLGELFLDFVDSSVDLSWVQPLAAAEREGGAGPAGAAAEGEEGHAAAGEEEHPAGPAGVAAAGDEEHPAGPAGAAAAGEEGHALGPAGAAAAGDEEYPAGAEGQPASGGGRLPLLRLRSAVDCYLGEKEVGLLSGAAAAVHIEAPRVLVTVGPEEEEEEGEEAAGAAAASGGSAARLRAGLALLAAAAPRLPRLTLVFKDLALLQVSPACTMRFSLAQLLQRAGLERAEHAVAGGAAHTLLAPEPGRQWWFCLELARGGAACVPADQLAALSL